MLVLSQWQVRFAKAVYRASYGNKGIPIKSKGRSGFLDKAADLLKQSGMDVGIFDGVEPDPSVRTIFQGAKAMQEVRWGLTS